MILTTATQPDVYEQDYQLWLEQTIVQLRLGKFVDLDRGQK